MHQSTKSTEFRKLKNKTGYGAGETVDSRRNLEQLYIQTPKNGNESFDRSIGSGAPSGQPFNQAWQSTKAANKKPNIDFGNIVGG